MESSISNRPNLPINFPEEPKKISPIILILFFTVNLALAHDYWIPEWRGSSGASWAVWDNWIAYPGPMPADAFASNPNVLAPPEAHADPASAFLMESWTDNLGDTRTNVLQITGNDEVMFHLDNFDQQRLEKQVWFQITYDSDHAHPAAFNVVAGYDGIIFPLHVPANLVASTEPPGWVTAAYEFSFAPNPTWEDIWLKFDFPANLPAKYFVAAYVDQVVIDTRCVPEPATLMLVSLGGLAIWRKRRWPPGSKH